MVIETIILGTLLAITIADMVVELVLKFTQIIDWFKNRRNRLAGSALSAAEIDEVGFTLQNLMSNNQYRTIQGVLNTRTKQVSADARAIMSNSIDPQLANYHRGNPLVIYD